MPSQSKSNVRRLFTQRRLSDYNTLAQAIADSYGRTLILDVQGNVDTAGGITISQPIEIIQDPGCVLRPSMAAGDSVFVRIASSDVRWKRPEIDGSLLPAISTVNKYMILAEVAGGGTIERVAIERPEIYNCEASDGNVGITNLLVTHAIYGNLVNDFYVDIARLEDISGCGIFGNNLNRANIRNGLIDDTGWASMQFDNACYNMDIAFTRMLGTSKTAGRYWGGSINLMSLQGNPKNRKVRLFRLVAEGPHNYGSVFRCLSTDDLDVIECEALDCTRGTNPSAPAGGMSYFASHTRGVSSSDKQDPPTNNHFHRCKGRASGTEHRFIECQNPFHTNNPMIGLSITENECRSPHETNHYFSNAIVVHGQDGGYRSVRVVGNPYLQVKMAGGMTFDGAIDFIANSANGQVRDVVEGGNHVINIRTAGWGSADRAVNVGSRCGPFSRVETDFFDNFFYGTVVTGTTTDIRGINDQIMTNMAAGGVEHLVTTMPDRLFQTNRTGTTAARPVNGERINYELRYNSTTKRFEYFAGDDAEWIQVLGSGENLDTATTAQLQDITHAINTKNKYRHKIVRNSTTGARVFANGGTAGDIWITADAVTSYTPV